MKQVLKYAGYILIILIIGFLIWRFYYIIVWLLIAAVISFIGQPLVQFFNRIHIKKLKIPHSLSALLALVVIVLVFIVLIANSELSKSLLSQSIRINILSPLRVNNSSDKIDSVFTYLY